MRSSLEQLKIIYWHLPDKEGEQKLTVQRDGHWWLAKAREDWWNECRLTPKQFDRAIRYLEAKHLVVAQVYKWHSVNTKHIRVHWAGLLQALSMLDTDAEKVVGFRRREPVHSSDKPRRGTSTLQSGELPISQFSGLPISQFSGLPVSQSKDGLIGNSRIDYQVISELPNREFHNIDLEITSEIRGINYSSPLTPQGEASERYEQPHMSESDQEGSKPNPLDLQPQQPELLRLETKPTNSSPLASHQKRYLSSGEQADVYSWDKFPAAPAAEKMREKSSHQQPIQTILPDVETDVATDAASVGNKPRACYELCTERATNCLSIRTVKATRCSPTNVCARRS